jgi:hypothetical protein
MSDYSVQQVMRPDSLIMTVLNEIGTSFPDQTLENIRDLVEHNELGVALSVLCSQISEYGIQISARDRSCLADAACLMGIPLSDLDGFTG